MTKKPLLWYYGTEYVAQSGCLFGTMVYVLAYIAHNLEPLKTILGPQTNVKKLTIQLIFKECHSDLFSATLQYHNTATSSVITAQSLFDKGP
jgi:hypothetical protein